LIKSNQNKKAKIVRKKCLYFFEIQQLQNVHFMIAQPKKIANLVLNQVLKMVVTGVDVPVTLDQRMLFLQSQNLLKHFCIFKLIFTMFA
jgi:hypothetical protein